MASKYDPEFDYTGWEVRENGTGQPVVHLDSDWGPLVHRRGCHTWTAGEPENLPEITEQELRALWVTSLMRQRLGLQTTVPGFCGHCVIHRPDSAVGRSVREQLETKS